MLVFLDQLVTGRDDLAEVNEHLPAVELGGEALQQRAVELAVRILEYTQPGDFSRQPDCKVLLVVLSDSEQDA